MTNHVLFMPDGNKRYSKRKSISLEDAYKKGAKTLELFSTFFLLENNWQQLTMHYMSKYTHQRTDGSLKPIYDALIQGFKELNETEYFFKNKLKFIWMDHSQKLPAELIEICDSLEEQTKEYKKEYNKIVRCLLGYDLETDEIQAYHNSKNFEEFKKLRTIPNINLVVRTTEMRPSKGPVYAMSQAQMILINKLNPELRREDLVKILEQYESFKGHRTTTNPIHKN